MLTSIPEILKETNELVFEKCNLVISNINKEIESKDYFAYKFELNTLNIVFRIAKITPKKIGQFVTLWKRNIGEQIQPYNALDTIDLFVINTKSDTSFGQFVFPKSILIQQKVLTTNLIEGKRAIRVYPPWEKTINKQAQETQKWQLNYFLEIPINLEKARLLYMIEN